MDDLSLKDPVLGVIWIFASGRRRQIRKLAAECSRNGSFADDLAGLARWCFIFGFKIQDNFA
jgi:hypothetical protein